MGMKSRHSSALNMLAASKVFHSGQEACSGQKALQWTPHTLCPSDLISYYLLLITWIILAALLFFAHINYALTSGPSYSFHFACSSHNYPLGWLSQTY